MLTAMPLHKLEREVEKLDGYLAKFNRLMSEAPEEFRDAVEVAFIGMTDRFKIYEQALKKKSSVRRRDDSDSDSGDDDDGGHGRDLRASATPVSYSNKRIKRESPEPLLPRNNGRAWYHDATRQAPSSAISTAGPFARNKQAIDTAETGPALSRDNSFNFNFTFHHPPPTHDDRVWVPAIPSSGQPRSPPSLDGAFAWPRPSPSTAHGMGHQGRIVGGPVMRSSGVLTVDVGRVKEEEASELEYLEDADEDGEYDEEDGEGEGARGEVDEDDEEGGVGVDEDSSEEPDDEEDEDRGTGRPSYCHPYRHVYPEAYRTWCARQARAFTFVPPPPPVAPAPAAHAAPAAALMPAPVAVAMPNAPAMYPQVFHLPPLIAVPPPATRGLHVPTRLPSIRDILEEYLAP